MRRIPLTGTLALLIVLTHGVPATAQELRASPSGLQIADGQAQGTASLAAVDGGAQASNPATGFESLRPSAASARLTGVPQTSGTFDGMGRDLRLTDPSMAVQERNSKGLPFMIAGGAAFVAGLLIGKSAGTAIAVGGVALGVYGIIVYF